MDSCSGINNRVKMLLEKKPCCYVLITCGEPAEDGSMRVEMAYEGDLTIAAYLLQNAQAIIDEHDEHTDNPPPCEHCEFYTDINQKIECFKAHESQ